MFLMSHYFRSHTVHAISTDSIMTSTVFVDRDTTFKLTFTNIHLGLPVRLDLSSERLRY